MSTFVSQQGLGLLGDEFDLRKARSELEELATTGTEITFDLE
jgi:hypothetical protein